MTQGSRSSVIPDDAHLASLLALLRRHRRLLLAIPAIVVGLAVTWALVRPRTYTSRASFLPQRSDLGRSGLGAIANQLGLNVSLDQTGQSPAFYAVLLQTPELLGLVVDARYATPARPDSGNLAAMLDVRARTPALERDAAIRRLMQVMDVRVDPSTDIVRVFVRTGSPELSEQVAARLLEEVNRFNVERRQSRATAERKFSQERRELAARELEQAEGRLQRFLEGNRNFTSAPALVAINDRLRREVSLRQQVYTTLTQAYEQARLDEVRNTPVITLVERPEAPVRPDSRRLVSWLAVSLLLGLLAALAAALLADRRAGRLGNWLARKSAAGVPAAGN